MKLLAQQLCYCCSALALTLATLPGFAEPELNFLPESVTNRRSEFMDTPQGNDSLKDPFFPRTTRYGTRVTPSPTKPNTRTTITAPAVDASALLTVGGVSFSQGRPIALINGREFAEDEEGVVRTKSGEMKLRVLKIERNSVLIQVQGESEPKQLPYEGF